MAATLLQTSSLTRTEGTGTTQTFTFASGVPAGSSVVLSFVHYPGGNPTGITDNLGNTYSLAVRADAGGNQAEIWHAIGISSNGTTPLVITATFSAGGNYTTGVGTAWSGIQGLDRTASSTESSSPSTSHVVAASLPNTQADMLAFTCAVVNDAVDNAGLGFATSGWTLLWRENNSNGYEAGQAAYRAISAVETTSVTHSSAIGTLLNKVLATYRVSSGGGGGAAALAASAVASCSSSASLTTGIRMSAVASSAAGSTAALSSGVRLAANAAATASATAQMTTAVRLASAAQGNATGSGQLSSSIRLAAAPSASSAASGALGTSIRLQASALSGATSTANLTTSPGGMAASPAVVASASAVLSTAIRVSGSAIVQNSATAALTAQIRAAASCVASAVASASLLTAIPLAASAQSSAVCSASLSTSVRVSASVLCRADGAASLSTAIRLASSAYASSAASGVLLSAAAALSATASVASSSSASLATAISVRAALVASPASSAALGTAITASASAVSTSSASAALTSSIRLAASVACEPAATASLSYGFGLVSASCVSRATAAAWLQTAIQLEAHPVATSSASASLTPPAAPVPRASWAIPALPRSVALFKRETSWALGPRRTYFVVNEDRMKTNITPIHKRSAEAITVDVDASAYLGEGVTLVEVESSAVGPETTTPLTVSAEAINSAPVVIAGRTVAPGKAIKFLVSGGDANGQQGRSYHVRLICTTSRTPDIVELTVPIKVDDFPYNF